MIGTVWRRARAASRLDAVVVATDDARIAEHCREIGADVRMTSPDHPSGSDRVREVVDRWPDPVDVVVNVQGDEPLITGTALDRLVAAFDGDPDLDVATLWEPVADVDQAFDPNVVKIVADRDGRALYFSRAPVPYPRDLTAPGDSPRQALRDRPEGLARMRKHQGVYAFRRDVLDAMTDLPPSPLERAESLEQLRLLEAGYRIRIVQSDFRSVGVDTPDDLERAAARLAADATTDPKSPPEEADR